MENYNLNYEYRREVDSESSSEDSSEENYHLKEQSQEFITIEKGIW